MAKEIPANGESAPDKGQAKPTAQGGKGAFVTNTRRRSVRKRNQKPSGGWLYSPGTYVPHKEGYENLVRIAPPEHLIDGRLTRIQVGGFRGNTRIYVWTTSENDPDGIEVKHYERTHQWSIADFLVSIDMRPEVGIAERFDLIPADAESPIQPALMIDLSKPLERRYFPTSKRKTAASKDDTTTEGQA